jgi:NADH:ubiquinone oxidoreductase subunit 4 (subunit M)
MGETVALDPTTQWPTNDTTPDGRLPVNQDLANQSGTVVIQPNCQQDATLTDVGYTPHTELLGNSITERPQLDTSPYNSQWNRGVSATTQGPCEGACPSSLPNTAQWAIYVSGAVKVALVPVHSWLCKVHVECSTVGSTLLAGVAMKGGYYVHQVFLGATVNCNSGTHIALLLLGGCVVSLDTLSQVDGKRWIAMYSVGHVQLLYVLWLAGGPLNTDVSISILSGMIAHSVISASMFLLYGATCDATLSRVQSNLIGKGSSSYRAACLVAILCNGAYPGTALFMTETVALGATSGLSVALTLMIVACSAINMVSGLVAYGRQSTVTVARVWWSPASVVMAVTPLLVLGVTLGSTVILPADSLLSQVS